MRPSKIKIQKKIDKQKSYVQLKLAGFCQLTKFAHPITLEPEVTGDWYSGFIWTLIGCTLCVLSMKTIGSDSFFEYVISHGMTLYTQVPYFLFLFPKLFLFLTAIETEKILVGFHQINLNDYTFFILEIIPH